MKILIAEDEPKARELLRAHFEASGHSVTATGSSLGMFQMLYRDHPDVLLLDMWLEDSTDGLSVLREVRRMVPTTKVVVVTGVEEESTREDVLKLGAAEMFQKPIRLDELDRLLVDLQNRPQNS
jgi:DNA-binding response OmpR family regulator